MDSYDFVIIGAGPAGEAAAFKARDLGASVAIIDERWFGGSCPFIGCIPSKSLLNSAARHVVSPEDYPWSRASVRRDYMIDRNLDAAEPDDSSHVRRLEDEGATVLRGRGTIVAHGHVEVRGDADTRVIDATNVMVAVGSRSKVPPVEGLDRVSYWTNREATLARDLPRSLLVLGGGPTGCELAQVYARFGVPTSIVQSGPRLMPTDHPRNSAAILAALRKSGVTVRLGVCAQRARAGAGTGGA